MSDRKFHKLKRTDLLEMIAELQESEARLQEEVHTLRKQLDGVAVGSPAEPPAADPSGQAAVSEHPPAEGGTDAAPPGKASASNCALAAAELRGIRRRRLFWRTLGSTAGILAVVAAAAVLIATLFLPVLRVSGESMEPTLRNGDMILLKKGSKFETGELIGLRYEGKVLLKRVIGGPGDYITIEEDGTVYVNGEELEEPYVTEKSLGVCDLTFPYQVPENAWFVLGDHRSVSIDSRSSTVGCIREDQIIGKVLLRFWPLGEAALIR